MYVNLALYVMYPYVCQFAPICNAPLYVTHPSVQFAPICEYVGLAYINRTNTVLGQDIQGSPVL